MRTLPDYEELGTMAVGTLGAMTVHMSHGCLDGGPGGFRLETVDALTVYGVRYRVSAIVDHVDSRTPTIGHLYTARSASFGPSDATPAAKRQMLAAISAAVVAFHAARPDALRRTRVTCRTRDVCDAEETAEKTRRAYEAACVELTNARAALIVALDSRDALTP